MIEAPGMAGLHPQLSIPMVATARPFLRSTWTSGVTWDTVKPQGLRGTSQSSG